MRLLLCTLVLFTSPAFAHEWYGRLQSPITGGSCCSEKDCHAVQAAPDDDGTWWVWEHDAKQRVPVQAILHTTAPDGNSHVCISSSGAIVCFIKAEPKS